MTLEFPDAPEGGAMSERELDALIERLERAHEQLSRMRKESYVGSTEYTRLKGKAEGVSLALSYARKGTRVTAPGTDTPEEGAS